LLEVSTAKEEAASKKAPAKKKGSKIPSQERQHLMGVENTGY